MFLYTVPGPVSGVSATPGVVQVNISWNPPLQPNGAIINYEVGFTIGTGAFSYNNTLATHFVLEQLPPKTVVAFSIRAQTIIGPGGPFLTTSSTTDIRESMQLMQIICTQCASSVHTASISVVSAVYVNSTSVRVTWTPLNLPVVDHYTVHYSSIVNGGSGRRRRQTDSGSVTFPASVSSGVVSGLLGGQQYQFSVSVTLSVGGHTYTGVPDTPLSTVTGVCILCMSYA